MCLCTTNPLLIPTQKSLLKRFVVSYLTLEGPVRGLMKDLFSNLFKTDELMKMILATKQAATASR